MYNLFKLSNGLRIAVEDIDYVNSVSLGLFIENGSRNEDTFNNGISHFIEHMFFKGTSNRTAKEIAESIEDVGGQINAFTGKEATCFYIKTLDTHLNLALDILSDMLFNSNFSEEDIEKEKGVVIEEINMNEDSPEDVLTDLHSRATWGEDSISLPILGTVSTVSSFTRDEIINYFSACYIPENSVISISGKVDITTIEVLMEKYFSKWSSPYKKITNYSNPKILNNNLYRKKKIEQTHISLGIHGMPICDDDLYSLLILNNIFGGGASSILFQKIREEMGLCYSIYSYISAYYNTGVLNIYAGLNPEYTEKVVQTIKEEMHTFALGTVSQDRLNKAKEQLKGNYILGLESTSSRMFNNGKSVLSHNVINTPEIIITKINKITQSTLSSVMERTFSKGLQNSAFVGENLDLDMLKLVMEGDVLAFKNKKSKRV